jgi:glucose-1-phosphate adenylyltransferase
MDFRAMIATHHDSRADVTLAVIPVGRDQVAGFGIVRVDESGRVVGFVEKPKNEQQLAPVRTDEAWLQSRGIAARGRPYLASMGIYLFSRPVLFDILQADPQTTDFGKEVFPRSIATHHVQTHLFDGYWEDLGTIKSYHDVHLELARDDPPFDFSSPEGVIYTHMRNLPAARISTADVEQCLVSDGCLIQSGTRIERSVIGVRSVIGRGVTIRESVLLGANYFEGERRGAGERGEGLPPLGIGDDSVLERVIVDKNCRIGRGVRLVNRQGLQEAEGDNYVIREGIVVIPNGAVVPDGTVI